MKKTLLLVTCAFLLSCQTEKKNGYAVCSDFDGVDAEILSVIDQVNSQNAGDKEFLVAFKSEHLYWIQYRDKRLRSMYPKNWDTYYRKTFGKDVFNPCKCQELLRLSENRLKDLKMYLNGGPSDQKDCPSMLN